MKFKLLIFLSFWGVATVSFGQYKQMLNKPYKEKVDDFAVLYENMINRSRIDSLYIKSYTREMEQWAESHQDEALVLEAELLRAYTYWFLYGFKDPDLVNGLILVANKGKEKDIANIEARSVQVVALHYWDTKSYEKAFEWLLRLSEILREMEPESFPNMADHLNFIGRCYFYFEDYQTALTYYLKSSELKKTIFNARAVIEAQATVGLCYQKLGKLSLAESYFLMVINDSSQFESPIWKAIAAGNLGQNYYLEGVYEKAVPLLKTDIKNAILIGELGLAAGAAIPLASIYLEQGKYQESRQKIEEAKAYIRHSGHTDRFRKLYPVMSKWYAANNKIDSSNIYFDSAMAAIDQYNQKYSALKLLRANQKVEAQGRKMQLEKLQAASTLKLSQRNSIILVITILLLGSILAFWFRNKYLIKEQDFKDLILKNTKADLVHAKSLLNNLTQKVREDSKLILDLKKDEAVETNQNLVSKLKERSILTQEDWEQYQIFFHEVYPNFYPSLIKEHPDLSQSEIRYLYLEKLRMNKNEMALVLGISIASLCVTKHRVRKKMELDNQKEMEAILKSFG
jgi:tetratricopeptide (TPR) repeat protein